MGGLGPGPPGPSPKSGTEMIQCGAYIIEVVLLRLYTATVDDDIVIIQTVTTGQ